MRSLNRVMLIGHLASDVENRQTKAGKSVSSFPVATSRFYNDAAGEKKSVADFHRVVAWGKLGEICQEYLAKGSKVFIEGRIVNRSYEDKSGVKRYRTEIYADDLSILTWKKDKEGDKALANSGEAN